MFASLLRRKADLTDAETPHVNPAQLEAPAPKRKKRRGFASTLQAATAGFAAVLKGEQPAIGLAQVLKYNPYHDEHGRFTSGPSANFVDLKGKPYAQKLKPAATHGPALVGQVGLEAVHNAVKQQLPKAWLHEGTAQSAGDQGLVAQAHTWSFATKKAAADAVDKITHAYGQQGYVGHDGAPEHLTMDAPVVKGSTVTITTYHKPKLMGPPAPTPEQQAAMDAAHAAAEKDKLKAKVPETMPEPPKSLGKLNPYVGHQKDMSAALQAGQKLFQSGDLEGLKQHADDTKAKFTTQGYTTPNDAKLHAYLDTLTTALDKHQTQAAGMPTEQGDLFKKPKKVQSVADTPAEQKALTAGQLKAKAAHSAKLLEKAVAELKAKHPALTLAAADLAATGKNSAAKAKLAQLDTAKAKLAKYGMDPEAISALGTQLQAAYDADVAQKQKAMQGNVNQIFENELQYKKGTGYSATTDTQHPLYAPTQDLKQATNAEYKAHPGLYGMDGNATFVRNAKAHAVGLKSAAITAYGQTFVKGDSDATEAALKKANQYGATNDALHAAELKATNDRIDGKTPPKTLDEALTQAKAAGLSFYTQAAGKYDYSGPYYGNNHGEIDAAHDAYQAAKDAYVNLGGNAGAFATLGPDLKKQGAAAYTTLKDAIAGQKQAHITAIQDAAYAASKALHQHGQDSPEHNAAVDKLNAAIAASKGILNASAQDTAAVAGVGKHASEVANKVTTAMQKVGAALNADYALRDEKGLDHPDTQAAMAASQQVLGEYGPDLPAGGLDGLKQQAKAGVEQIKKAKQAAAALAERLKHLGADAAQAVAGYDAHDASFKYPKGDTQFAASQKHEIDALTPDQREVLSAYTGSFYTSLNKQVGAFGTAKLMGQEPPKLSSEKVASMQKLDAAFEQVKLGQDVRLRRNFAQKYFWNQLGVPLDTAQGLSEDAAKKLLVGKIYKETAYSSTSMDPNFESSYSQAAGDSGKMTFHIRAGAAVPGIRVKSISSHSAEEEVVLGRGTTYVIRDVQKRHGQWALNVDAIGMYPDPL